MAPRAAAAVPRPSTPRARLCGRHGPTDFDQALNGRAPHCATIGRDSVAAGISGRESTGSRCGTVARVKEPRDTCEMNMPTDEGGEKTGLIGHQKRELWMGGECLTLADLWPQNPRAVLVGINPAATSVEVGHYYQGPAGRRMFGMLRDTGILGSPREEHVTGLYDDDLALSQGIGFTDLVKRPTPNARSLEPAELDYGARLLEKKLRSNASPLVIFVFKKTARTLFGKFEGIGLLEGTEIGGARCFVMPHYSARVPLRESTLANLKKLWEET